MTLPKQKKFESDADYATRLEIARERHREYVRKHREANRETKREYDRKYREANREAVREYERKYREANREAKRERDRKYREANKEARRAYREANKEAIREYERKYREANKEAIRERDRQYREANKEAIREAKRKWSQANIETTREYGRKHRAAKALASAKGKPLRADYQRAQRPVILTKLLVKVAEDFCRNYGFPLEEKWDTDVLKHAAGTIRNSPELYGAANPWYGTDYLVPGILSPSWAWGIRKRWRNRL